MYLFVSAYRAVQRAMTQDQRRETTSPVPLWRLLIGEVGLLAKRVGTWRVTAVLAVVAACVLSVEVALSDTTPGPALAAPWRWAVAGVITTLCLAAWAVIHALRSQHARHPPPG